MFVFQIFSNFFRYLNKNIFLLAGMQIFSMTALNINIITTALAGFLIAPYGWMSTLPLSLQFIITMFTTVPASLLMSKLGRKPVFIIGSISIIIGGILMAVALILNLFLLFCFGSMFLGIGQSITQFYRYAATDTVPEKVRPKAMSLVLSAGLAAAFLGPTIYESTAYIYSEKLYAASFFAMSIIQLIAMPFIYFLEIPKPKKSPSSERKVIEILKSPSMIRAVVSAAGGYSIMSYLMTATPLQIVNICKFGISDNALIIQWHVVAMFAPSFFTGSLIQRFNAQKVLIAGIIAYIFVILIAVIAETPFHYLSTLFLLGIGWNFLYVGGSSLIVKLAKPSEQGKIQGIADLIIFGSVATASLSAGLMHYLIGWDKMVLWSIPILIIIAIVNLIKIEEKN